MISTATLLLASVALAGIITVQPVTAIGVVAGLVLTLLGIRYYLSNIWRAEAEGYEKALARQREENTRQVSELKEQIAVLAQRIQAQDAEIARLQKETNVVPLFEMSREIKQIAENSHKMLDGRTALIERINEAVGQMTAPQVQQQTMDAIAQIRHLVEESDQRSQENAELFGKLYKEVFPMIARIYAVVVEGGGVIREG